LSTPDEMTPDGVLYVDVHAVSHTFLGYGNRGKRLRDHWTAYYIVHYEDGTEREDIALLYDEHLMLIDQAGYTVDWPNNARIDLDPPIGMVFDENRKLIDVAKPRPERVDNISI
jgi:hypothetical protein